MILNKKKRNMKTQFTNSVKIFSIGAMMAASFFSSCREDKIKYDIPETYNFDNVSYSGQTSRLDMFDEISDYLATATTPGTVLDAQHLRDMFENQNNPFTFTATKQLKDKCFLADQTQIETWMDAAAASSSSTQTAAQGIAGIATSLDGNEKFLFDANGFEPAELIEKGIMGAVFYYQAVGVYLTESKTGSAVDNTTITEGEGTPLQHHWDEAFGYFGAPKDFPTNTATRFWAKVCAERNAQLASSAALMTAFITGRAAINHDDHETKAEQITIIRDTWEKVIAATAIHELNEAKSHLGDDALRNHEISEAIAYTRALKYSPTKKITDSQIQSIIDMFGTDLYTVTLTAIDGARTALAAPYGLESIMNAL
jgi:hypothetical protein